MSIYNISNKHNFNNITISRGLNSLIQNDNELINKILRFSRGNITLPKIVYHNTKSVKLNLIPQAIRNKQFNYFSGKFNDGYPLNTTYYLCNQKLSSIIAYGNTFYGNKYLNSNSTYIVESDNPISETSCDEQNLNPTPTPITTAPTPTPTVTGPTPTPYPPDPTYCDPISAQCGPPPICVQDPPEMIELPPNLKTTIKGYAFYLDQPRQVNIPDIGDRDVLCGGGHVCCRTTFTPQILTNNNIYVGDEFDMNNLEECPSISTPVVGFIAQSDYERSAQFTIEIPNINSELEGSLFMLNCTDSVDCHTGVTMVFLVVEDATTNEATLIFNNCVGVGCSSPVPVGSIVNPSSEPIPCVPENDEPTPNCNQFQVQLSNSCGPLEFFGGESEVALAMNSYLNDILTSLNTVQITVNPNGTFGGILNFSQYFDEANGTISGAITVSGTIGSYISVGVSAVGTNCIGAPCTTVIFAGDFNIPGATNPYDTTTNSISSFGGWAGGLLASCQIDVTIN
jgi:hypothetical protein